MNFGSRHQETTKLGPQRITVKGSEVGASFSGIVHFEVDMTKHSDLSFDVRTEKLSYKKLRSEYFLSETNNWLIRALLYSHYEHVRKCRDSCRKIFEKLMKYYSKPNVMRVKQKTLSQKVLNICQKIFGEFSVSYQQTACDSYLNK